MTTVLYVLGTGHSGSTLLDLLLGSHDGFCSSGELAQLPRVQARNDPADRCTCGGPLRDCRFWRAVHARAALSHHPERSHRRLIDAIAETASADVVIDSSKDPDRLVAMAGEGIDVRAIHLVRDARAVARSHQKKGRSFEARVTKWVRDNEQAQEALATVPDVPRLRMRYEDLVLDTGGQLDRVFTDLLRARRDPDAWRSFRAAPQHMLAGNRMRFRQDPEIALDDAFLSDLSARQWWWGTVKARGMLRSHGYPLARSGYRDAIRSGRDKDP